MSLAMRWQSLTRSIDLASTRAIARKARLAAGCALVSAATACGATAPATGVTAPETAAQADVPIAAVHTSKCGACHTRPAPGTRERAHLEEAFTRHKKRVHMTDEEWRAMVDYLALAPADEPPAARDSTRRAKQASARE